MAAPSQKPPQWLIHVRVKISHDAGEGLLEPLWFTRGNENTPCSVPCEPVRARWSLKSSPCFQWRRVGGRRAERSLCTWPSPSSPSRQHWNPAEQFDLQTERWQASNDLWEQETHIWLALFSFSSSESITYRPYLYKKLFFFRLWPLTIYENWTARVWHQQQKRAYFSSGTIYFSEKATMLEPLCLKEVVIGLNRSEPSFLFILFIYFT